MRSECQPPRDGRHVFLSIDTGIQGFLEEAVGQAIEKYHAKWGVGILVNPQSGQVLAMCSLPSFNPNEYSRAEQDAVTNKALSVPYEPGSALKPVFAAAAVDAGVMTYDTPIFCENGLYVAPRGGRISDHGSSYGTLSLTDVVVYSSNIGMAKVGEALGNNAMYAVAQRFGFGHETGIELPGESRGIVRRLAKWDGYSTRRVPFGQEISVTSLQLTMAFAAHSNGGWLLRPRVVDCVRDAARADRVAQPANRSSAACSASPPPSRRLAVLREVVLRGTGKACQMERWSSFGKTGTAQIAQDGQVRGWGVRGLLCGRGAGRQARGAVPDLDLLAG